MYVESTFILCQKEMKNENGHFIRAVTIVWHVIQKVLKWILHKTILIPEK